MPRVPRQQRAKATVDAILAAGFICLARSGPSATTTAHIAETAGVGVGSLYEYFANKDAVYEAMHQRFLEDLVGALQPLTPRLARMPVTEAIPALLYAVQDFLQRDQQRYLLYARVVFNAEFKLELEPVSRLLGDLIVQYLMQHPQYASMKRLAAMSYIFVNAGMFTVIRHQSDPHPPISYDELVDGLTHMVSHYVRMESQLARKASAQPASDSPTAAASDTSAQRSSSAP